MNPPKDTLSEKSQQRLEVLLSFSPLLHIVWEWKEAFTTWYDCFPSYAVARLGFDRCCEQRDQIDHPAVRTLKTMRRLGRSNCELPSLPTF
ncbi:transposase [Paenibacillus caui]|uniref:transposase n=1 Tax=Paenibacillus caui TaxID=2873927 RepID=UPI002352B143|nr:transposase [Paenibacillus caui]